MFPGHSVLPFALTQTSIQVTFEFPAQLVNSHKEVSNDSMMIDDTGSASTSTSPQKRLKRPRPPLKNTVPEILKTPTSPMKKLRLSPEKGSGRSTSPSKPGGDYFASVVTDSEEEEGEVGSGRSGKLWLMLLPVVQGSACVGLDHESPWLTDNHPQC